ncbi:MULTISPECIES: FDXHR family putative zinc-binding protein [unclassified Frankia]
MAGRDNEYERPILLSCGGCDVRWTALTAAHCPSCHETFAGTTTGFDAHRVKGTCLSPERAGLRRDRGYWLSGDEQPPGRILRASDRRGGSAGPAGGGGGGGGAVRMAG